MYEAARMSDLCGRAGARNPGRIGLRPGLLLASAVAVLTAGTASTQAETLFKCVGGRSFYTWETQGHLLVWTAERLKGSPLVFEARHEERILAAAQPIAGGARANIPIAVDALPQGESEVVCRLLGRDGELLATCTARIHRRPPQSNEVKIDHVGGGLIVDRRPFFPFGFYCELPLRGLPEEEVVHGFNMLTPYRPGPGSGSPRALEETRAYLDQCGRLGIRVNHDLRQLAEMPASDEKWAALRREVEAFRDHPALLTWYLADEPEDRGTDPGLLAESYRFIRSVDPYHPVTIVFCNHHRVADYADAMDLTMADWYPIPRFPVAILAEAIGNVRRATRDLTPHWFVPQAFGGGEHWSREPSAREQRVMTYLALIERSTGIKYFIRRPPIGNPMSPVLWSECRRLALETAALAPALLSEHPRLAVTCSDATVHAAAWQERGHITVLAVNVENRPKSMSLRVAGFEGRSQAEVVFENRRVDVAGGSIEDMIDAFGTRAYRFPTGQSQEDLHIDPRNLVQNPSFELAANPGTPDGCYVGGAGGRGASAMVDPWVARHGLHSLRMITPADVSTFRYTSFWMPIQEGTRYRVSLWAKADRPGTVFRVSFSDLGLAARELELGTEWREYVLEAVAAKSRERAGGVELHYPGPGTAWFDLLQVVPQAEPGGTR